MVMLATGARVRLCGLKAKPELNGRTGVIKEHKVAAARWTVLLENGGGEFAFKADNLELLHSGPGGLPKGTAHLSGDTAVIEGLDVMLAGLRTTRQSVLDAMAFCMEHSTQYGTLLAQRLARALGKPGLSVKAHIARLFLVSDVLHNSKDGGDKQTLAAGIQEALPEACEKMGRTWLRRIETQEERDTAENSVRQVLQAWQDWAVFPPLFVRGLESLLLAQVYETSAKEAGAEPDEKLRRKMLHWFSGLNQAQLPHACQQRGLSGKVHGVEGVPRLALSMATCRARLCHFERYWHCQRSSPVHLNGLVAAPHLNGAAATCVCWDLGAGRWKVRLEDGNIKAVRQENMILDETRIAAAAQAAGKAAAAGRVGESNGTSDPAVLVAAAKAASAAAAAAAAAMPPAPPTSVIAAAVAAATAGDDDSMDGDPLTQQEFEELEIQAEGQPMDLTEVEVVAGGRCRLKRRLDEAVDAGNEDCTNGFRLQQGYGVWTQVTERTVGCLVAPADYCGDPDPTCLRKGGANTGRP